ncbi:MAG: fatty-acid synthase [Acidobacteria bacterium]|nr:fatty-acid synthase [Acidobacteriota bacterium]
MPRRDRYHQNVCQALLKDGWEITNDPLMIYQEGTRVYLDLAAERKAKDLLESVAIEIKVFGGKSQLTDFENAVGQYELYRTILAEVGSTHELYLALPQSAWMKMQTYPTLLRHLRGRQIHLLVFNPRLEEIVVWIKQTD